MNDTPLQFLFQLAACLDMNAICLFLGIGHIVIGIEPAGNLETLGGCLVDVTDNMLNVQERLSFPMPGNKREELMLYLVMFAGSRCL